MHWPRNKYHRGIYPLLLTLVICLFGCSKPTLEEHLKNAQAYVDANDLRGAIIEYKNAVVLAPNDPQIRLLLAKSYLKIGAAKFAVKELNKASALAAKPEHTAPLMMESLFLAQAFDEIDAFVASVPISVISQNPGLYYFYQGWSLALNKQGTDAVESLERLNHLEEGEYKSAGLLLLATLRRDEPSRELWYNKVLSRSGQFNMANLLLGQLAYLRGELEPAIAHLAKFEAARPAYVPSSVMLAHANLATGDSATAAAYIDKLMHFAPDSLHSNALAANNAFLQKDYEQAFHLSQKAIQAGGKSPGNYVLAGISAFKTERYEAAYQYLAPLKSRLPSHHVASQALRLTQVYLDRPEQTYSDLIKLDNLNLQDVSSLNLTSLALIKRGRRAEANELLQLGAELNLSAEQHLQQGVLKLSLDEIGGLASFEAAIEQAPDDIQNRVLYALALYQFERYDQALVQTEQILDLEPALLSALNLQAAIYVQQQEYDLARTRFEQVLQLAPGNGAANLNLAKMALNEGNFELSQSYLQNLLQTFPRHLKGLALLIYVHQKLDTTEQALDAVTAIATRFPEDHSIQMLLADLELSLSHETQAVDRLTKLQSSMAPLPTRFWQLYVSALVKSGDVMEAMTQLRLWLRQEPDNVEAIYKLAVLHESRSHYSDALQWTEKGLRLVPEDGRFSLLKVQLLLELRDLPAAKTLLASLEPLEEYRPILNGLRGQLLAFEGRYAEALPLVLGHYDLTSHPRTLALLFSLYQKLGQVEQAELALRRHLIRYEQDQVTRMLLANVLLQRGDPEALEQYLAVLEGVPDNLVALNNVAWLLLQRQAYDDALVYALRALELFPNNSAVLDTSGQIYLQLQQVKKSVRLLEKANKLNPEDQDIALHFAQALVANAQIERARGVWRSIASPRADILSGFEALEL